ncbi:MAG: serine/threonine protein kinase [Myxococcales bacterium]|nr:serine/threonine protein kinase [Myxococcales bacterium]
MEREAPTFHGGRFVLERELGRGHFGVVYAAFDRVRGEQVALKAAPGRAAGVKREFSVLESIGHPNVVRALECFHRDTLPFFTMELIAGDDFVSHVRRRGELEPPPAALRDSIPIAMGEPVREPLSTAFIPCSALGIERLRHILPQTAEALDAIHVAGYVHGDLQPSNVLVTEEGRPVVLDLELAGDTTENVDLLGTAAYLAPEHGEPGRFGPAVDWYSLGVMVFEAITGQVPFEGHGPDVLARKQATNPPDPAELVGRVPDDLRTITLGLLRTQPGGRFGITEVLRTLTPS